MTKSHDLTDKIFGKWTVLGRAPKHKNSSSAYWRVRCSCGKEREILATVLHTGRSMSCISCVKREKTTLPGESAKWSLFISMQNTARRRKKTFNLTLEEFLRITGMACHYCGVGWSSEYPKNRYTENCQRPRLAGQLRMNGTYKHNGIDRVDSKIGYISENCVPCCKSCNVAKAEMTQDQFREWIERAHKHFVQKTQPEMVRV